MPILNPSSTPNPEAIARAEAGETCFSAGEVYSQFRIPDQYVMDGGASFWQDIRREFASGSQIPRSYVDREDSCKFFKDRPCNGNRHSLTIANFYYKESAIFEHYNIDEGLRERYLKKMNEPMVFPLELVLGFDELVQAQKVYYGGYSSGSGFAHALGQYAHFAYHGLIYNEAHLNDFLGSEAGTEVFNILNLDEYRYIGGIGRRMAETEDHSYKTMILGVNGKASDQDLSPVDIPDLRLSKHKESVEQICELFNCSTEGFDSVVDEHGEKWITYIALSKDFFGGEDFSVSVYYKKFFDGKELEI